MLINRDCHWNVLPVAFFMLICMIAERQDNIIGGNVMTEQITKIVQATEAEVVEEFGNHPVEFYEERLLEVKEADFEMDEATFGEPDTEGEIDEHAIAPLCGSTGLSGAMYLGVNKSGSNINVRSGASTSHSIVGKLYPLECFAFTGTTKAEGSYTWYKIEFRNPNGNWIAGWYRGTNGMSYWKNNAYSSVKSADMMGNNSACKTYIVKSTIRVWNGDKSMYFDVAPGHLLLCKDGYQGKTGSSEHSWLLCHGVRYNPNASASRKDEMIINLSGGVFGATGYANTNIKNASTSPKARGNW